jgi:hypothetical protein
MSLSDRRMYRVTAVVQEYFWSHTSGVIPMAEHEDHKELGR